MAVAAALLAASLLAAGAARAAELTPAGDGAFEVRERGVLQARVPISTPPLRRGTPTLQETTVDGHRVATVRVPVRGTAGVETWVGELGGKAARPIWSGVAGPRDSDGETALLVEITAGDDGQILEYQTAAAVTRCDGQPVRLFPRGWDFAGGRFRPVVSPLPAPAATKLVARRDDAAAPSGRPRPAFRWTAASTTPAEGRDARGLTAPTALDDGDPATAWSESLGGDGRGEFVSGRAPVGAPRVVGLRFSAGDVSSAARFRARNRLHRFQVAFGPAAEQRFDVEIAEDPLAAGERGRQPYWVALPQPVAATCLTVVLTSVYPGAEASPPRTFGTTAISELDVFTELDQGDGAQHLIADVASGTDCAAKVSLLVSLGDAAVAPIAQALEHATTAGRGCLVEALARQPAVLKTPAALDALARALAGATPAEEQQITATLVRAEAPPVDALGKLLAAPDGAAEDRARAAAVLGALGSPAATAALLAAAGRGPEVVRGAVLQALQRSPHLTAEALWPLLAEPAKGGDGAVAADLLRVLPAVLARKPEDGERGVAVLQRALLPATPFEVRGRAVMALGALSSPAAVATLSQVRESSDEPVLRYLAARELGASPVPAATTALRAALLDKDPRVRETAALGLGQRKDRTSTTTIISGAKQEPWPAVRRAELEALGNLCGAEATELMIRAIQRDVDAVRRAAVVGLARCRDPRASTMFFRILGRVAEPASMRSLGAALLGDVGDAAAAAKLAAFLPTLVTESDTDPAVEGVAAAALRSLGRLGGPAAARAVAALAGDQRRRLRLLAIPALGAMCEPTVGVPALRRLADGDAQAAAAQAAQAAWARCQTAGR